MVKSRSSVDPGACEAYGKTGLLTKPQGKFKLTTRARLLGRNDAFSFEYDCDCACGLVNW
jgi:hypothetical protein